MTALSKADEAKRLSRIRSTLAGLQDHQWLLSAEADQYRIQSKTPDGIITLASFGTNVTADELDMLSGALDDMRLLMGLVDRAIDALRVARPAPSRGGDAGKDFAAECAMKCADPAFKTFLEDVYGLERPLTDKRVATKVRSICAVTSRRDLNDNGRAADSWKQLRGQFENWKRAGQ